MGYERSTLRLTWPADSEFGGLEVRMERVSVGRLLDVSDVAAVVGGAAADGMQEALDRLLTMMGESLLSWNLTRRGEPVPATVDGLRTVDMAMVLAIAGEWVSVADAPLATSSGSAPG